MEEAVPATWKYGGSSQVDTVISPETETANVEAEPLSPWKYGGLTQEGVTTAQQVEAYKSMVEAEMANFVLKAHPQEAPPASKKDNSRTGAPSTPRTPTQRSRGIRSSSQNSRSASADRSRPYAKIAEHSRGSLRQSRTPLATSGSLLRAASLSSRPTTLLDSRYLSGETATEVSGKRVPAAMGTREARKQEMSNTEPEPEKSCPSTPSLQTRQQRPSTAPESPRSKAVAVAKPKAAFGRSAIGHTPRSPRMSATREDAPRAKEIQASATRQDKERARIARAAVVAEKQRGIEEEKLRVEEQRRRNIAGRERARADREAAHITSLTKKVVPIDAEALEKAWVDVNPML